MDARLLDVIIGVACFIILVFLLAFLPVVLPGSTGVAYLTAILIFILALSGAGYIVNRQIA
jgi:hypothetical protein